MNAGFLYVHVFTGHILLKFLLEQEFYFHYIDHMLAARCYKTRSQLEAARGVALFGSRSKGKSWKICISYNHDGGICLAEIFSKATPRHVHHRNGDKTDNGLANLEIQRGSSPPYAHEHVCL